MIQLLLVVLRIKYFYEYNIFKNINTNMYII